MADQSAVIAFLSDPASHGGISGPVQRIDTHVSHIFLAGDRAYKLKRAVTLPFLDFARLEDRRRFCEIELAVNRRTAPMLYRAVRAIRRDEDGRLSWDGAGPPLDWVVEMNRFDQDSLFDRLAQQGHLTRRQVQDLADAVNDLHRSAAVTTEGGGFAGLKAVIDGIDTSFRRFVPQIFDVAVIDRLMDRQRDGLARLAPLLDQRRAAGKVRRCHGDLHLGNICLIDGRPVLFDAIEFSEDIATIDVAYDLAFLLMDFDERGLGEFAALLLSRCLAASDDIESLAMLPLLLSMRAAIRSHIAAAMGKPDRALLYRERALGYLTPPPPRLIAVGGLSGSGKSHLARCIAPFIGARPGALVLRSDVARKHLMGVSPETRLSPEAYDEKITDQVYRGLFAQAERALRAGHAVILDAVFARPEQRRLPADLAASLGLEFRGLWLDADPAALQGRIEGRRNNASDATVAVLQRQLTYDLGSIDWDRIDSSGDKAQTVDRARAVLSL